MNRETQDELSAAEAAMHEASATVEQVKPTPVQLWCVMYKFEWYTVFYFSRNSFTFLPPFYHPAALSHSTTIKFLHRARSLCSQP